MLTREKQNNNLLVQPDTKLKIQYYQFRIFLLTNSKLCRSKDLIVTSFPEAKEEKPRVVRIVTNCAKRRRSQDRFWKRREAKTNPAAGQIQANRGWSRCGVDLVFVVAHGLKIGPASQFPRLTGHRFNQPGSRYLENWLFAPRYSGAVSSSPPLPPPLSWDETRKTPRRRILSPNSHTFFIFLSTFSNKNDRCRSSFRG